MSALLTENSIIEARRNELIQSLENNKDLVMSVPEKFRGNFKQSFLELGSQEYLLSKISPREITRFAARLAGTGLSINPVDKEVYILPFDTKINDQKVMVPQAVIPLNGIQEMAFSKGFFFRVFSVYKIDGQFASEFDMPRELQAKLNTTDPKWVEENFIGFDVVLNDLLDEGPKLPEQKKFIEKGYVVTVTKGMLDDKFKIQTWIHKAARRAYNEFFIPRARRLDVFDQIDTLNNELLGTPISTPITPPIKQLVKPSGDPIESLKDAVKGFGNLEIDIKQEDGKYIAYVDNKKAFNYKADLQKLGFKSVKRGEEWVTQKDVTAEMLESEKAKASAEIPVTIEGAVVENTKEDNADEATQLKELGLTIVDFDDKGETWEKIEGNTSQCELTLAGFGFRQSTKSGVFARRKK